MLASSENFCEYTAPVASSQRFTLDPSRVQAAVFDLGGVLIEGGPRNVVAFGATVGLEADCWEAIRRQLFGNQSTWARLERGEVSLQSFVDELAAMVTAAGGNVDAESATAFMGRPEPMATRDDIRPRMLEAVRTLKKAVPTALLTNNIKEWRPGWNSIFDDDSLFDVVVDSSAVGSRKPERKIYEITRDRLGVDHDGIFFVDDIGQNLKAAHKLGWQTLLYTSSDEAVAAVRAICDSR